jgi:hypothetical protein
VVGIKNPVKKHNKNGGATTMRTIPEQQKRAWGRLIVMYEISGSIVSMISMCRVLINCFRTGIISEAREKEYLIDLKYAADCFEAITKVIRVPERNLFRESEIIRLSQMLSERLMPLCILNGYLIIDAASFNPEEQSETKGNFSMIGGET